MKIAAPLHALLHKDTPWDWMDLPSGVQGPEGVPASQAHRCLSRLHTALLHI